MKEVSLFLAEIHEVLLSQKGNEADIVGKELPESLFIDAKSNLPKLGLEELEKVHETLGELHGQLESVWTINDGNDYLIAAKGQLTKFSRLFYSQNKEKVLLSDLYPLKCLDQLFVLHQKFLNDFKCYYGDEEIFRKLEAFYIKTKVVNNSIPENAFLAKREILKFANSDSNRKEVHIRLKQIESLRYRVVDEIDTESEGRFFLNYLHEPMRFFNDLAHWYYSDLGYKYLTDEQKREIQDRLIDLKISRNNRQLYSPQMVAYEENLRLMNYFSFYKLVYLFFFQKEECRGEYFIDAYTNCEGKNQFLPSLEKGIKRIVSSFVNVAPKVGGATNDLLDKKIELKEGRKKVVLIASEAQNQLLEALHELKSYLEKSNPDPKEEQKGSSDFESKLVEPEKEQIPFTTWNGETKYHVKNGSAQIISLFIYLSEGRTIEKNNGLLKEVIEKYGFSTQQIAEGTLYNNVNSWFERLKPNLNEIKGRDGKYIQFVKELFDPNSEQFKKLNKLL